MTASSDPPSSQAAGPQTTTAQAVAALWASLHGLASLSTSGKLGALTDAAPADLARLLVSRFLAAEPDD